MCRRAGGGRRRQGQPGFWPLSCTFLLTIGELYLSPIGLSLVTKVSPARIVSMMMGMWFIFELPRQHPVRLHRQLLEPNRQAGVLPGRRRHCRDRRRGDLRLSLAAARHVAGMTAKLASRGSRRARRWAPSDVFRGAGAPARPRNFTA